MKRARQAVVALIVAGALAASLAGAGSADPGSTVTIHEVSTFTTSHQPPTGTFTATGLPVCATGTSGDQLVWFSPSGARLVVDRTYTCTEGGPFTVRLGLHLGVVDASGTQASDATWRIVSTAGALTGLQGSGTAVGVGTGCSPVGVVFAECTGGTSTVTASIH
jgi:hypothetical protein